MTKRQNKRLLWQLPILMFLIAGTVIFLHRKHPAPYRHNSGFIFGTIYNITYQSDQDLNSEIVKELKKVDNSLSPFNDSSIISHINRNENVKLNNMFTDVFTLAEKVSKETDGAFDITVAPLVNEWGFGFKKGVEPNKHIIDSLKDLVGYNKVRLSNGKIIKKDNRMMLDCSAIAKGYGSDVAARYLLSKGITNFMVEIGGEIVTKGLNDKNQSWKIGVTKPADDPLNTSQELQSILQVTDIAMATSGNYRNFYYKGGKKYAHTIDPKTGYPVQHNILSSTVLAKDCATADAYATSFMVLGLDKAKKILEKHPELMVYFIYSDEKGHYQIWSSPSMKDKIEQ